MRKTPTLPHAGPRRIPDVPARATSFKALRDVESAPGDRRRRTLVPLDSAPLLVTERPSSRLPTRRALVLAFVGVALISLAAMTTPAKRPEPRMRAANPAPADASADLFGAWDDTFESEVPAETRADTTAELADVRPVDAQRLVLIAHPTSGVALPPEPVR